MDFIDLLYLTTCADIGNFTRAAAILGLDPSTVSRRISRLEDELGLSLFERSHSGIKPTVGCKAILAHACRALAELEAIRRAGYSNGLGNVGQISLGVRIPPIGAAIRGLLAGWRIFNPNIPVTLLELNDRDVKIALRDRRIDVALVPDFMVWPDVITLPLYREQLVVALPTSHPFSTNKSLTWPVLAAETILVQGWEDSQTQQEFFASLLGNKTRFDVHSASKQSVFALVQAGYGITLAAKSQSETSFPGLIFLPIAEPNAWFQVDLVWLPEIEEPVVGRFVAFMRDEARSRGLL